MTTIVPTRRLPAAMGHDSRAWLEEMEDVEAYAVAPDGDYWCTLGFEALADMTASPLAG